MWLSLDEEELDALREENELLRQDAERLYNALTQLAKHPWLVGWDLRPYFVTKLNFDYGDEQA